MSRSRKPERGTAVIPLASSVIKPSSVEIPIKPCGCLDPDCPRLYHRNYRRAKQEVQDATEFIGWARSIASRIVWSIGTAMPPHMSREDLIQDGYVGLLKAARTFNASKGVPFEAWAVLRVRAAVIDSLRSACDLRTRDRETPKPESLSSPITTDEPGAPLGEAIASGRCHMDAAIAGATVRKLMKCLNDRERQIVDRRYFQDKSTEEIAAELGISKQRVRQLIGSAFAKIRYRAKRRRFK